MARIVIASDFGAPLEVEQSAYDAGFFPGYIFVGPAPGGAPIQFDPYMDAAAAAAAKFGTQLPAALKSAFVAHVPDATGVAATDTAAIQSALDAAATAGGGTVQLGIGIYLLLAILNLPTTVSLVGTGATSTILKQANGANLAAVLQTQGWTSLTGTASSAGMTRNRIASLTVDGNKANNSTGGVVARLYGWSYALTDVIFQNGKTGGLTTEWGADISGTSPAVDMGAIYTRVRTLSNDGHGWAHYGPHDSTFIGISSAFNTGDGWRDFGGPTGSNGAGSHVLNFNGYVNGGRAFSTDSGGMVGQDVAVSGPAPSLLIGDDSGLCTFTGLTAQSVDIRSPYHRVSGLIVNGFEDVSTWDGHGSGVRLAGNAVGVVLDVTITNCRNGINFEDDAPGSFVKALIVPYDSSSTTIVGTPNTTAALMLRYEGVGVGVPGGRWYAPDIIRSNTYVQATDNVNAGQDTFEQVVMGFAGPSGEPGLNIHTDGLSRFYRSAAGVLTTNAALGVGNGGTGDYNAGHLTIGTYHLWVDSTGRLRVKNGAPTSSTDGTVVGTQT